MAAQKTPNAGNLMEFIQQESEGILSACTQCGLCFAACPMRPYADGDISAADPKSVVGGILSILRGEQGAAESLAWVGVCMASGECIPACPENVNPLLMVRMARMIAGGGTGLAPQMKVPDDIMHFPRVRTYARIQLSSDEINEWL